MDGQYLLKKFPPLYGTRLFKEPAVVPYSESLIKSASAHSI